MLGLDIAYIHAKFDFDVNSQLLDEFACRERAKGQLQTRGGYFLTVPY